jgi:hypothetical protein
VSVLTMSFFESIPPPSPPAPVRPRRPAWMRSDAVIPGSVAAEAVLVRTEQAAVAVGSVRAYPNGFEFTLHTRERREDETRWRVDPFDDHGPGSGQGVPGEGLRLGIMFADGRRWDGDFWVHPLPPQGPVTLVVAWPKYDIPETATELDGAAIRDAAGPTVVLWPEDPDYESTHSWATSTMAAGDPDDPSPR